jgi:hypothetical protein
MADGPIIATIIVRRDPQGYTVDAEYFDEPVTGVLGVSVEDAVSVVARALDEREQDGS